jgi:2-keto-4-pentenoate hydratase
MVIFNQRPIMKKSKKSSTHQTFPLAAWLVDQHATRLTFAPTPTAFAPTSASEAVAVQNAFVNIKARQCGPTVGWKIALATPTMQKLVGLDAPIAGRLHRRQVVYAPARTATKGYGRLLIEFEIAVQIGRNLPAGLARHTGSSVASAVSALAPAFELADDRRADYALLADQGLQILADNAWNEGAVLGAWVPASKFYPNFEQSPQAEDALGSLMGEAFINGASVGHGYAHELMGHPFNAVAWLANEANDRGTFLKAGDIAILGSLVTSKFPTQGDALRFELEGFAPIMLQVD